MIFSVFGFVVEVKINADADLWDGAILEPGISKINIWEEKRLFQHVTNSNYITALYIPPLNNLLNIRY